MAHIVFSVGKLPPHPEARKVWPLPRITHQPGSPVQGQLGRKLSEPVHQAAPLLELK